MPLRVLVITPIYPWPGDPPEGIFIQRQIRNLARLGVQCRVINYHPALRYMPASIAWCSWLRYHPRWLTWRTEQHGIPVAHLFYPRSSNGEDVVPAIARTLERFIAANAEYQQTDVIYAHWLWTGGAVALRLRERFGWPVAAIARGSEMHDWHKTHPLCRPHVEQVVNHADLVLTNCDGLRRRAAQIARRTAEGIEVVYNGCDARMFTPSSDKRDARKALGLPLDSKLLLCCASVIRRKGISELIAAWRAFAARRHDWRLVLVGRLVQHELVQRLRQDHSRRITIVGRVSDDRVARYMQAADAYIQPSLLEGLANATMEAMASGLPVIATDAGGQREAVRAGQNGWLVSPGDVEALVSALDSIAGNMEEARLRGSEARKTIQTEFDPMDHARRLRELLDELVRPKGQPALASHLEGATTAMRPLRSDAVNVA